MSNNKYKILVVEDDRSVSSMLKTMLDVSPYECISAENCCQGLMMLGSHMPDLVILDLGLPDKDGMEFIRAARQGNTAPILVLSARSTENDKVEALDLGANDYITKPFSPAELMARVRAALRAGHRKAADESALSGTFELHELVIHYAARQVTVAGEPVHLTQTEYNILTLLAEHAGKLLTYAAMHHAIWGEADPGGIKKLQVNMANLRKKLGIRPGDNRYIVNELGVGYRMPLDEE